MPSPTLRAVLISGGNTGLGLATIKYLVKEPNVLVYLGSRSLPAAEKAIKELNTSSPLHPVQLDVSDDSSILAAVESVKVDLKKRNIPVALAALVNNAGIYIDSMKDEPPACANDPAATRKFLRDCYDVNVFGAAALTEACMPLLRAWTERASIINVSSGLASFARLADQDKLSGKASGSPFETKIAYNTSKIALNGLTVVYARANPDMRVVAIAPGMCKTGLNDHYEQAADPSVGGELIARATLDSDGPSMVLLAKDGPIDW